MAAFQNSLFHIHTHVHAHAHGSNHFHMQWNDVIIIWSWCIKLTNHNERSKTVLLNAFDIRTQYKKWVAYGLRRTPCPNTYIQQFLAPVFIHSLCICATTTASIRLLRRNNHNNENNQAKKSTFRFKKQSQFSLNLNHRACSGQRWQRRWWHFWSFLSPPYTS